MTLDCDHCLAGGRLCCIGGQQELKSRFSHGNTLEVRVDEAREPELRDAITALFPGARLESSVAGKVRFALDDASSLASVFDAMEARKAQMGVLDYSASQPSLESIFLSIAERGAVPAATEAQPIQRAAAERAVVSASAEAADPSQREQVLEILEKVGILPPANDRHGVPGMQMVPTAADEML